MYEYGIAKPVASPLSLVGWFLRGFLAIDSSYLCLFTCTLSVLVHGRPLANLSRDLGTKHGTCMSVLYPLLTRYVLGCSAHTDRSRENQPPFRFCRVYLHACFIHHEPSAARGSQPPGSLVCIMLRGRYCRSKTSITPGELGVRKLCKERRKEGREEVRMVHLSDQTSNAHSDVASIGRWWWWWWWWTIKPWDSQLPNRDRLYTSQSSSF